MKALKTKVILSGIVLVFAFIATIGTTFAWFTISETVAVDGISLQVTSSDNLLIRVDSAEAGYVDAFGSDAVTVVGDNYQSSLNLEEIMLAAKYTELDSWRLNPVTAINSTYTGVEAKNLNVINDSYLSRNLTEIKGIVVEDQASSGTTGYNSIDGGFIELHFWLYSQAAETRPVEVTQMSISANNGGDVDLDPIADAIRFGIWMQDSTTVGESYIFGNDTDFGFSFDEGNAGWSSPISDFPIINSLSETGNINYSDPDPLLMNPPLTDVAGELTNDAAGFDRVLPISANGDHDRNLFNIVPLTPTLVTVRIFIEGWDQETTNSIVNAFFNLTIGFRFGTGYTVSFDSNGGENVPMQDVSNDGIVSEPTTPIRDGYAFDGWYTSEDGGTTLSATAFDFVNDTVSSDTVLYAKWTQQ
ncbi:InlB B-repeat-containing protein [Mycoplasmatota bacterium]|nr:InlB B-repeat-containing protein [Mycoplasmatota bacterium]